MFAMSAIAGIPDFIKRQAFAQVINVPVMSAGIILVMPDSGFQPPRAESTARVDIVAGLEVEGTEFAYNKPFVPSGFENQCICSGFRVHEEDQ